MHIGQYMMFLKCQHNVILMAKWYNDDVG